MWSVVCFYDPYHSKVIIGELLSLATIVAYIICSLFWKSTSAAYESLDSNTEDEEEVTNKKQTLLSQSKMVSISGWEQSAKDLWVNCRQPWRRCVRTNKLRR